MMTMMDDYVCVHSVGCVGGGGYRRVVIQLLCMLCSIYIVYVLYVFHYYAVKITLKIMWTKTKNKTIQNVCEARSYKTCYYTPNICHIFLN